MNHLALVAISALLTVPSGAASTHLEEIRPQDTETYLAALRVVPLPRNVRAVIHREGEPGSKAIVTSIIDPARGVRQIAATAWVSTQSLPAGMLGQVFAIAPLSHDLVASSIAWLDRAEHVRTDVVLLDSRTWTVWSRFEARGVRDVVAGPDGNVLSITFDFERHTRHHDAPLLTLFGRHGEVLGEFMPFSPETSVDTSVETAHQARLARIDASRYLLLNNAANVVTLFRLEATIGPPRRYSLHIEREIPVTRSPADVRFVNDRIGAFCLSGDGVIVTRQSYHGERPTTAVVHYDFNAVPSLVWESRVPWRAAFLEDGELKGVVKSGEFVGIETAEMPARHAARGSQEISCQTNQSQ